MTRLNMCLAQSINKLSKRAMHRVGTQFMDISRNQLSNVVRASVSRRNNPGDFKGVRYIKEGQPVKGGTGKTIPNHESYHVNLQNTKTKEIIGGFTTHPKPNETNYYKISDQKLNGEAGEQYLGVYNSPKIMTGDIKIIRELPEMQPFLDKHESYLHTIEQTKKQAIREDRTSKNDSRFYNEDGTRDYDNFPNK